MTLFPSIDPSYYTEGEKSISQLMDYCYASSIQINQSFWSEADIDARFLAGDQTLWNDIYGNLPAFRRRQFNFNRIRRIVNLITGYQRQHRLATAVVPRRDSGQQAADDYTKILSWTNGVANTYGILSDAFMGSVTTGMNLLGVWMDYREDPINGDIKVDNLSYNEYLIDPFFRKHDMSDCRFVWVRKWLSKLEIRSLLPGHEDEVDAMYARGWRDGKFQFQPEAYNYAMQDLLSYDEFWYADYRKRRLLVDTETGDTLEWRGQDEGLAQYVRQFPQITYVDQTIPTAKLAIAVNGKVLYNGPNPMGIDRYPYVPVLAYYAPEIPYFPWRVQGVVRGLRDSQYLYNRRKIIELDILESQVNSGVKYIEDTLVNPKDAFLSGQGRQFVLKKGALMTDLEVIQPPQVPSSMMQLSAMLAQEIQEISGVNEELLGAASDSKTGVLSMLRQGAGLTTLQVLYDQLSSSQKWLGEIFIELVQANFSAAKVKKIIGKDPEPEFFNRAFPHFECVVEEAILTSTQKQMALAQALELKAAGMNIPDKWIVDHITMQDKGEMLKIMAEEQKAAMQAQQHQMQVEQLKIQKEAALADASAQEKMGLAAERFSRVAENESLSVQRKSEAALNEVKAVKELQDMDITQLQKMVEILAMIKQTQQAEEQTLEGDKKVAKQPAGV
jgi:hypothetical protein